MIKIYTLLLVSVLFLFSCKKDDTVSDMRNQVAGTWEFYRNFNFTSTPADTLVPGNGRIIVLYENGEFERKAHDTLLFKGKYYLTAKKDCQRDRILLTTNEQNDYEKFVDVIEHKLNFSTSTCLADGGGSTYKKIQ